MRIAGIAAGSIPGFNYAHVPQHTGVLLKQM
jgi:hypothetical protein